MLLILEKPARLSTDIDILVEPGTDVDGYIEKASKIFPFIDKEESFRKGKNSIVKRHFKFSYQSPLKEKEFYILLDIVFSHSHYAKTLQKEIKNDLLLTTGENLTVEVPAVDCILGDKLTAFAQTYEAVAREETEFRGESWNKEDILRDTIRACISIISKGTIDKEDYAEYLRGIKSLRNHVLIKGYNTDDATRKACPWQAGLLCFSK